MSPLINLNCGPSNKCAGCLLKKRGKCRLDIEIKVLGFLSDGLNNKQIGFKLSLTEASVEQWCSAIYKKIGVQNRSEAVAMAIRKGMIK